VQRLRPEADGGMAAPAQIALGDREEAGERGDTGGPAGHQQPDGLGDERIRVRVGGPPGEHAALQRGERFCG
jgi:hypothetical protein